MRIIAGIYGGRHFKFDDVSGTHPMSEKIRGAIFNSLGDLSGLSVLDAYSGSGAVGLEALSRGAEKVLMIEKNPKAAAQIRETLKSLNLFDSEQISLRQQGIEAYSNSSDDLFDIIICDPPHDKINHNTIGSLKKHLKATSSMLLCYPGREHTPVYDGIVVVDNRSYGDAQVAFYSPS